MAEETNEIDIDELQPNPLQPRGQIVAETLMELAESIREHGILEPLVVAKTPAGYQIIAGERRWRASKLAGLTKVPCTVKETTMQGMLEMSLVENAQRVDLNPLERAQAFKRLQEEFHLSSTEVAQRIGKSSPYISNTLRLLELPDAIKDGVLSNLISEGTAKVILSLEDTSMMIEAYKKVLKDNLAVRGTEELVRKMKGEVSKKPHSPVVYVYTKEIGDMENNLASKLNSSVKILKSAKGGKITIRFHSDEDFANIYKKLLG